MAQRETSPPEVCTGVERVAGAAEARGVIYKLHPEVVGLDYLKVKAQILSDEAAGFVRAFVAANPT